MGSQEDRRRLPDHGDRKDIYYYACTCSAIARFGVFGKLFVCESVRWILFKRYKSCDFGKSFDVERAGSAYSYMDNVDIDRVVGRCFYVF